MNWLFASWKKTILGLIVGGLLMMPGIALAVNLLQVYQQALARDPVFKAAEEQYLITQENVPIAGSQLLPNINLSGSTQRQIIKQIGSAITFGGVTFSQLSGTYYNTSDLYNLNISQPIFNLVNWRSLKNAHVQVKQASAKFSAQAQDLMVRTAQAYFNVALASDTLHSIIQHKKAVAEQLYQISERYKVGMAANADLEEAKANYESVAADEISARNDLAIAIDALRVITGVRYKSLMGAGIIPLISPNPDNLTQWIELAQKQNYSLLAAIYGAYAAQENIEIQSAGHWPVINLTGGYQFDHETRYEGASRLQTQTGEAGVSLKFPVYQGGLVNAKTQQARYQYQQALADMEQTHREIIKNTENAYLTIITDINKIRADQQVVHAKEVSLQATTYGYHQGIRTILDVLNVQTSLYQAKIDYSKDRYNYLLNLFLLKQAVGTLNEADLLAVNAVLRNRISIAPQIAKITEHKGYVPKRKKMDKKRFVAIPKPEFNHWK